MDLLDKLRAIERRRALFAPGASIPGATVIERVLGSCEVVVDGRPTLMFGSNNYLGLTLHPEVVEAAREALAQYGTGTTGSRAANGTLAIHEELERDFTQWFGKRHAMIFSTGYQANLSVIGGLCGPADVILIDGDSHASIFDATRQTGSQVVAFRHNSPESLRKKLARLPRGQRNRLVVVEGLYSIRGDVAPLASSSRSAGPTAPISLSTRPTRSAPSDPAGWAAPKSRACSSRSISSSARFRSRWAGSAGCACRITRSSARCTFWRGRTSSPRRDRRPISRACAPQCA